MRAVSMPCGVRDALLTMHWCRLFRVWPQSVSNDDSAIADAVNESMSRLSAFVESLCQADGPVGPVCRLLSGLGSLLLFRFLLPVSIRLTIPLRLPLCLGASLRLLSLSSSSPSPNHYH